MHAEAVSESAPPLSFEEAFRSFHPLVARTAGLVAHDAQLGADFAQEAFVRLYERWIGWNRSHTPGTSHSGSP